MLAQRNQLPAFQEISNDVACLSQDAQWEAVMLLGYGIRSEKTATLSGNRLALAH